MKKKQKIVDISTKSFLSAIAVLLFFLVLATVLTYVLPKGKFFVGENGETDYSKYLAIDASGINIFKAIFSPVLVFFTDGFLQPLMLSIFLLVIAGVFQVMLDCGGMQAIVSRLVNAFKEKRLLFLAILTFFFMCLGSFFGLFEETLILLPMVVTVCVSLGYDAFMGFLVCSLATGVGFSVALTNPFTVVYSSNYIGADVFSGLWFRALAFLTFYAILFGFIYLHSLKLKKQQPELAEKEFNQAEYSQEAEDNKTFLSWTLFLIVALVCLITFTAISFLRDLSTPLLAVVFLIGGAIAGCVSFGFKKSLNSFGKGAVGTLPAVVMISLAFAIKFILVEGQILDTITNFIATTIDGKSKYLTVLILFGIILILEFFISSSTAKAVFVMGVLSGVITSGGLSISKELLVLIYVFSDGFTNMLFPTSPCLLIGLSMTGQGYTDWLKKSKFLFPIIFAVTIGFILLATFIGY